MHLKFSEVLTTFRALQDNKKREKIAASDIKLALSNSKLPLKKV